MSDLQKAPPSLGWALSSPWTPASLRDFLHNRLIPVLVLVYQAVALLCFVAIPVLGYIWFRTPPIRIPPDPSFALLFNSTPYLLTYLLLPYFIGLIYLVSSLWVFGIRRSDAVSRAYALFTASMAIGVVGLFDLFTSRRLVFLWTLAMGMTGGTLLNLALVFPQETGLAARYPYLRWLVYLPTGALILYAFAKITNASAPATYILAWWLEFLYFGLAVISFLAMTTAQRFASPSPIIREQSRLLILGTVISFGPLITWLLLAASFPIAKFNALLLLPLAVFPLITSYTILRYRILNTDYLLSRAVLYVLLSVLVAFGYALLVSGTSLVLGTAIPAGNPFLIGLMVFILALLLNPLRVTLQRLVDSAFFRGQVAYRQRLQAFGRELTQAIELPTIVKSLRQYVQQALLPELLHIYVYNSLAGSYLAAPGDDGSPTSDLRFGVSNALPQVLSRSKSSVFLREGVTMPVALKHERTRLALLGTPLFIPLPGQERLTGWLALGPRRSGEPYTTDDLAFIESLCDQAALALERAQVVADLEDRVHEMDVLTRLAEGLNVTLAFDDLLELIYAQTNHLIPVRDFRITLRQGRGQGLYHAFYLQENERLHERENQPIPEGQGLEREVVRSQRVLITDDYIQECRDRGITPDMEGVYSWLGVPLNAGAETIGMLCLGSRDSSVVYTSEQGDLLQAIAGLTAGAIVKARLLEETELSYRQMSTLNEIARSLTSTLELNPLLQMIVERAVNILECEAGSLLLVDENTGESVFQVAIGPVGAELVGQRVPPGAGLVGKAVSTGQPIIQNDVHRSTDWFNTDQATGYSTQDLLVVPMKVKDRVIGVLEVLNKCDRSPFNEEDLELLTAFAGQAAAAIDNARLYTLTDQALAAKVEELSVMQRIDRELNASLDLERSMRITLEWAVRQSKADAGLVGVVSEERLRVMASQGYTTELEPYPDAHLPLDLPAFQEAVYSGQVQFIRGGHDEQPGVGFTDGRDLGLLNSTRSQIVMPIRREAQTIGLLFLESTSPSRFSEEVMAFLSRLSDHAAIAVANAQLYDAVQTANLAKSQFVSSAAHELKNPLTSIKGYSDLLVAGVVGPINENQASFLTTIRSNADRMGTLVSDLQDLSRIEAGQLRLNFDATPVPEIMEEVVRSLGSQIQGKKQSLHLEVPEGLPPVWGDRVRLVQILTNLVSNAHKYTPQGGEISILAERGRALGEKGEAMDVIHVSVRDTGIGIRLEDQRKIFQQFFRSEDPKVREVSGTGLGLNITKNLVEMMGGCIWFESQQNQGTTFHITVPLAEKRL